MNSLVDEEIQPTREELIAKGHMSKLHMRDPGFYEIVWGEIVSINGANSAKHFIKWTSDLGIDIHTMKDTPGLIGRFSYHFDKKDLAQIEMIIAKIYGPNNKCGN